MQRSVRVLLTILIVSVSVVAGEFAWSEGLAELRSRVLWRQFQSGPGAVVDFTQVGPSEWDRLFVFHPYTPTNSIHESLGYHWPDAQQSSIGSNEGVNLVVFTRGGRVSGWFDHSRGRGDLLGVASLNGYSREQSRFTVTVDQEGRLVLASR